MSEQDHKDNREYYDTFSESYEAERHAGYHKLLDELEVGYVHRFGAGKVVFEAGCGTGLVLDGIQQSAAAVIGMDLSHGMLCKAMEKRLQVVQGDITRIPLPENSVDLTCSFKVLAHVENICEALKEMARVTRPGGMLLLEFYNPRSIRGLIKRLKPPSRIADDCHDEHVFTRFDSVDDVKTYLPEGCTIEGCRGVRIFTPAAFVHKIPLLGRLLRSMERLGADSFFRRWAGFQIIAIRVNKPPAVRV